MALKNKKRNSFYFFMKEIQDQESAKGRKISMEDSQVIAGPIWAKMSLVERAPYDEMAHKHRMDSSVRKGKLASDGTRVNDYLQEIDEKQKLDNQMKQAIKSYCYVDCVTEEQFKEFASRKLFYFISFNIMYQTENEYAPNEIGLVEYSIQNGIHREYHNLIHPGRIHFGYAGQAKRLKEVHEIDTYGEKESVRDLKKIYEDIKNFTNPEEFEEFPPLFCLQENMELNIGCLNFLAKCARQPNYFDIWNAAYLLLELKAGVNDTLPSVIIATDLLTKPSFNYHPSARCEFHDEKDNHNCALAYSKRLCYLLSDATCNQFGIELTERHMPTITTEDKGYTITIANDSEKTSKNYKYERPLRLDSRSSYYTNEESEDQLSDVQSAVSSTATSGHRQPSSSCLAAEMARLRLDMTSATVPGHGIGRGQRR